jgi:hypothetical protein
VKCLHAHTADQLLRKKNYIGQTVLKKLEEKGVDPSGCAGEWPPPGRLLSSHFILSVSYTGCSDCWQQCDLSTTPSEAKWWYVSQKSRSKLLQRKLNRQRNKEQEKIKKERMTTLEYQSIDPRS